MGFKSERTEISSKGWPRSENHNLPSFLVYYTTIPRRGGEQGWYTILRREPSRYISSAINPLWGILGDPGAVSRAGEKAGRKFSSAGERAPGYRHLTELFPKIQADAGSWMGTNNALYYCAQSVNSFSWVLFVSSYTTAIVLPHLPGSFTKLVRARETFIFYFPNQKRRNYRWVENTFGMLSAGAIQFASRHHHNVL